MNIWKAAALNMFRKSIRRDRLVTGEDIRLTLIKKGLPSPTHHNVWGGFISSLIASRRLLKTNGYRHMISPTSNGRKTRVYRVA